MTTRIPVNDDLQSASERARSEAAATRNGASREQIRVGRQRVPLTDRQRDFIFSLSAERSAGWTGSAEQVAIVDGLSKSDASEMIKKLLAIPKLPMASQKPASQQLSTEIPDGRYALAGRDGIVRFYSVKAGTKRWEGYTFVKGLIGSPGSWTEIKLSRAERETVTAEIGRDWMAALKLYADKFECCGFCDSPLSDLRSRAARYGEKCAGNHGLHYPNMAEARAILGENA